MSRKAKHKMYSNRRWKQILALNCISRSFEVKRFMHAGKPIKHFIMLHNTRNTGFKSIGLKDITKNFRLWPPHCGLKFLHTESPEISARALCRLKRNALRYIFAAHFRRYLVPSLKIMFAHRPMVRKQVLLSARLSHRNSVRLSVCPSVCPSHGWISQNPHRKR